MLKVVGGPSSTDLAMRISVELGVPPVKTGFKRFPDGEFYFRFEEEVAGEELLLVQSLYPPQDTHLVELLIIAHTAKDLAAKEVSAYVPYLAYSRQDERYLSGEALSAMLVAELLQSAGVKTLYTVDVHNQNVLRMYRIPAVNFTAAGELARYFAGKSLKNPMVIAPDDEVDAMERARVAASAINADYNYFEKQRDRYTGKITTVGKTMHVKGRDVVIIDDIISTGHTAANAAQLLRKEGANRVFIGVTHALLRENALKLLQEAGVTEVVGTDSVPSPIAKVSTASVFVKALKGGKEAS